MIPVKEIQKLFRINGKPIHFSAGELEIFHAVIGLVAPRVQVLAPTQYGKSLTIALAVDASAVAMGERFIILAPSEKKAGIIMNYCIDHIFDNEFFVKQLDLDENISLDRLRRERSRSNLTFKSGGGVMVLTLDARNSRRSLESALGFGGNRLILDESSLIEDQLYSTVKRMLGGYPYEDTFLLEIGNPFYRNHFHRTWHEERYHKIFIDYKQGLLEGRYSPEFIDEMRSEAFFDVLYECKFPEEDMIDNRGFRNLLTSEQIEQALVDDFIEGEDSKLGCDIGAGGDLNVFTLRNENCAMVVSKNQSTDTMTNVVEVDSAIETFELEARDIFVDDIGVGRGVSDRLKEKDIQVNGISFGEPASDKTKFKNIKAECFWKLKLWIENGGKLVKGGDWQQLTWIKYRVDTDKMLAIESKDDLKKRTGKSPDYADSLALTFAPQEPVADIAFL